MKNARMVIVLILALLLQMVASAQVSALNVYADDSKVKLIADFSSPTSFADFEAPSNNFPDKTNTVINTTVFKSGSTSSMEWLPESTNTANEGANRYTIPINDWSGYNYFNMYVKPEVQDSIIYKIYILTGSGLGDGYWTYTVNMTGDGWQKVSIPFADFTWVSGTNDKSWSGIKKMYLAGKSESYCIYYDKMWISEGYSADFNFNANTVKDKWRYSLVGDESININDSDIHNCINRINANADAALGAYNPLSDGQSSDLFYTDKITTTNFMTNEYAYIYNMAIAYGTYGSSYYKSADMAAKVKTSLEWMYNHRYGVNEAENDGAWIDTKGFNWWDWQIGSPRRMIDILMIMESAIDKDTIFKYLDVVDAFVPSVSKVGSNMANVSKIVIGSSLLRGNLNRLNITQKLSVPLFSNVVSGEGFFDDGSYIFHTANPMNGSYGLEQFMYSAQIYALLYGTDFAFVDSAKDTLTKWIYDAFEPFAYKGSYMKMVMGRLPTAEHAEGAYFVEALLNIGNSLDTNDRDRVNAIIKYNIKNDDTQNYYSSMSLSEAVTLKNIMSDVTIGKRQDYLVNKVYYNMDRVVHQREKWAAGIGMSSSRIYNYESINNQNTDGWYRGDGMVTVYNDDLLQYDSMFWNYVNRYKMPGTTVDTQQREAVSIDNSNAYLSSRDLVGGVTTADNLYGTAAMALESYHNATDVGAVTLFGGPAPAHDCNLTAKKSWFMFDDEIVCLGSDINASNGYDVQTIIDNKKNYNGTVVNFATDPEYPHDSITTMPKTNSISYPEADTSALLDFSEYKASNDVYTPSTSISHIYKTSDNQRTWDWTTYNYDTVRLRFYANEPGATFAFMCTINPTSISGGYLWKKVTVEKQGWNVIDIPYSTFTSVSNAALNKIYGVRVVIGDKALGSWPVKKTSKLYFDRIMLYNSQRGAQQGVLTSENGEIYPGYSDTEIPEGTSWLQLNGTGGYYFPEGGQLKMKKEVNKVDFTQLWFDHGVNPDKKSYEYALLPGKTVSETSEYAASPDITVLANTDKVQAVRENKLGVTGYVFWEKGSFDGITVDKPMIIMAEEQKGMYHISVSDPTHKLANGTVTIDRKLISSSSDAEITMSCTDIATININFSQARGKSINANFSVYNLVVLDEYFTDGADNKLSDTNGSSVFYNAELMNNTVEDKTVLIYAASYNDENKLSSCNMKRIFVPAWGSVTIKSNALNGKYFKGYIWDDNMKPYIEVMTLGST